VLYPRQTSPTPVRFFCPECTHTFLAAGASWPPPAAAAAPPPLISTSQHVPRPHTPMKTCNDAGARLKFLAFVRPSPRMPPRILPSTPDFMRPAPAGAAPSWTNCIVPPYFVVSVSCPSAVYWPLLQQPPFIAAAAARAWLATRGGCCRRASAHTCAAAQRASIIRSDPVCCLPLPRCMPMCMAGSFLIGLEVFCSAHPSPPAPLRSPPPLCQPPRPPVCPPHPASRRHACFLGP
jgi:hypothetical protein